MWLTLEVREAGRMRAVVGRVAGWSLSAALIGAGAQDRPPQAPFRSGVDVIVLDVSVLDKNRHPVAGLTPSDFTVQIDGQPRPVVAFRAVDLPTSIPASAPWMREVSPDIATNTHPNGRVVVILIDDGAFGQIAEEIDVKAVQKTREVAKAIVDELRPSDLAAVVYTENNRAAQSFTTDRKRLLTAIDASPIFPASRFKIRPIEEAKNDLSPMANDEDGNRRGSCQCGLCSITALSDVSDALRSLPQQRKIVIYISPGIVVYPPAPDAPNELGCNDKRHTAMIEAFRQAALANVTVQSIDPKGLVTGSGGGELRFNKSFLRLEFVRTMAEATGGRAVVNDNEMQRQVSAVLAESSAYYLLGVEPPATNAEGRFQSIAVRVNRPGLEVRTRNGYYTPTAKERKALAAGASRDLDTSIAAALPKSDFPMDVAVAPFAGRNRKAELAVVCSVTHPVGAGSRSANGNEAVDYVLSAFNPETGKSLGTWHQQLNLVLNAANPTTALYEVVSRVPVTSGRYELRIGVKASDGRTASVYTYAEVPDFNGDALSLSGLVLSATPSPKQASKETVSDLTPVSPTARRTFRRGDRAVAFVRVYQGGSHDLGPVTVTTRIVDAANTAVSNDSRQVNAASFIKARSYRLPARSSGGYAFSRRVSAHHRCGRERQERTARPQVPRPTPEVKALRDALPMTDGNWSVQLHTTH